MEQVTARAYANIALIKYWGKQDMPGNVPATPSVSLALDALKTETTVTPLESGDDRFFLNDREVDEKTQARLKNFLDLWRDQKLLRGTFEVRSRNLFPTGAGLASSASGFAALARALQEFSVKPLKKRMVSRLARRGSGSAARSITGGLSALAITNDPGARLLLPAESIRFGMVVAVVASGEKKVGSTEGMKLSRSHSPYYNQWVSRTKHDYKDMLSAVRQDDFSEIGRLTEASALAMHACMIATRPALVYWAPATVALIHKAAHLREQGLEAYATIDAGAHVALLAKLDDLERVAGEIRMIDGVETVFIGKPGGPAEVLK